MASTAPRHFLLALISLGLCTAFVTTRYYTSTSFEQPIHFSIVTLFLTGIVLSAFIRFGLLSSGVPHPSGRPGADTPSKSPIARLNDVSNAIKTFVRGRPSSPLTIYILYIIIRTALWWRTIRTIQCSWDGVQAFLPAVLSLQDLFELRPVLLPKSAHDTQTRSRNATALLKYAAIALSWGIATSDTLFLAEPSSGAICPTGWSWGRTIPLAQLIGLACDAALIARVAHLRQNKEDKSEAWRFISSIFLSSGSVLALLIFSWAFVDRINFRWTLFASNLSVRDLFVDSVTITIALISAIYALGHTGSATVALTVAASSAAASLEARALDGTLLKVWRKPSALFAGAVFFIGLALLIQYASVPNSHSSPVGKTSWSRKRTYFTALAFLLVFCQGWFVRPNQPTHEVIKNLIAKARIESDGWIADAKKSTSLAEAVANYRDRYGMPPPPNFDKWYTYAVGAKAPIIDTYDQMHEDLLPFWGALPSTVRERTTHLLEHPNLSVGGIVIRGGKLEISPHILGTHRWMMDVMKTMIEPFAQWLPDMQLAFNLDDECRVSIPYDRKQAFIAEGSASRSRLNNSKTFSPFGVIQNPPWETEFLSEEKDLWDEKSTYFSHSFKRPIFYDLISPTCPASAPVNNYHWWNRKTSCPQCTKPHTISGIVSDWKLSGNLCHQPDMAWLHGFLTSPSALTATQDLFPVFSQSRAHNFADILYPSPWNFGDKVSFEGAKAIPWAEKTNSLYWRGASSDGYALYGSWETFLRARFVRMVTTAASSAGSITSAKLRSLLNPIRPNHRREEAPESADPSTGTGLLGPLQVNVSFVGPFGGRCETRDCMAEHSTFYGSAAAEPPPAEDFNEHWRHRHLADLDGAAFSGRFLPFMRSASLPYRAALFRTWWEERIHPWRHFVPLDMRLVNDLWPALAYFSGGHEGKGDGVKDAEEIARAGSDWAATALRKEDMQVYMFRLLLEWGRIVDDRREELGFVL